MSVPKLRFKEFDGNWSKTSFQDLFIFKNGVNASKEQYGSGIKFINVLDIINNPNGITYNSIIGSVDITSKEIEKNLVKYGDVLFQRSSETREEVGQSNVYLGKDPVVFGGFVIRGSAQKEYDPIFMNGLLKTDSLRDQITQLSGGSTRFNIGQDSLNKVSAYLPSKIEQTKIASFLSAVDEKISQLTQKHELLSQYKQGMMQKLFSQQIRFKADDGSEFGEWENLSLVDISTHFGGTALEAFVSEDAHHKFISIGNYSKRGKYIDNGQRVELNEKTQLKKLNKNDLVMVLNDKTASGDLIGSSILIDSDDSYIYNQRSQRIVCDVNKAIPLYVWHFLNSELMRGEVRKLAQGGTQIYINFSSVLSIKFNFPSVAEQTKIANFLSAIDQKIEKVTQQIEETKQWKKGLLQQMFV